MSAHQYTDEQMEKLAEIMPALMHALREIRDVPAVPFSRDPLVHATLTIDVMRDLARQVFSRLDDWCWHVPSCDRGENCAGGRPGANEVASVKPGAAYDSNPTAFRAALRLVTEPR